MFLNNFFFFHFLSYAKCKEGIELIVRKLYNPNFNCFKSHFLLWKENSLWKSHIKILGAHSYLKQSDRFRWQISGMNKYFAYTLLRIMLLANVLGFL